MKLTKRPELLLIFGALCLSSVAMGAELLPKLSGPASLNTGQTYFDQLKVLYEKSDGKVKDVNFTGFFSGRCAYSEKMPEILKSGILIAKTYETVSGPDGGPLLPQVKTITHRYAVQASHQCDRENPDGTQDEIDRRYLYDEDIGFIPQCFDGIL